MFSIDHLVGKRVLFFDLETTGFPRAHKDKIDYQNNHVYESSRIVQIGWCYYDQFSCDLDVDQDLIKSFIRKPVDFFSIHQRAVDVHKISYQRAKREGLLIENILDGEFGKSVSKCDYIISYNISFDFGILANEIHRAGAEYLVMYEKMMQLEKENAICMMKMTTKYLGGLFSQPNAYTKMYGVQPDMQHDAKGDVYAMLKILKFMIDNKKIDNLAMNHDDQVHKIKIQKDRNNKSKRTDNYHKIQKDNNDSLFNKGIGWTSDEETTMKMLYLDNNASIQDVAVIHKRTPGAIIARLKKLDLLKDSDKILAIKKTPEKSAKDSMSIKNTVIDDTVIADTLIVDTLINDTIIPDKPPSRHHMFRTKSLDY